MSDRPEQPPEGKLIEVALKRSGRVSIRKAAKEVPISEGRLRQIMHGYQTVRAGVHIAVTAPADTLARLAQAFDITPEQLEEAGRLDAAEGLRELTRASHPAGDTFPRTDLGRELLELAGTDRFLDRVRELLPELPPEDRPIVEEVLAAYLASEVGHREDQERKRRLVDRIIRRRRGRGLDAGDDGGHAEATG